MSYHPNPFFYTHLPRLCISHHEQHTKMSTTITIITTFADLPPELLQSITLHQSLRDHIRFRSVCREFLSSTPIQPLEFPWLMLPSINTTSTVYLSSAFFNPLTKTLHRFTTPESTPSRRCAGSSHGYLVLLDESPSILLFNPLTRHKVILPSLTDFSNVLKFDIYSIGREYVIVSPQNEIYYSSLKEMRDTFVKKVIVSNNPCKGGGFVAFAILNRFGELAYCKDGDLVWRVVGEMRSYNEDVICFNGRFYAVDKFGSVAIFDVSSGKVLFINVEERIGGDMQYLVDGMGELLLISRYLEFDIDMEHYVEVCRTVKFCVYRLDVSGRKWERVMSLEDKVLFIGENSSFALLASDYVGCEGNRIYYTDDYSGSNYDGIAGDQDVGVYDLEDGTTVALPCYPRNSYRPIWIIPTLR